MYLQFKKITKFIFNPKIKLNIKDTLLIYQNYSQKILYNMEEDFKTKLKQIGK
jgi:hypothetical protein